MTNVSDRARRQLHALARTKGIEVRWRAQDGAMETCSDETLLAILQLLRVDVHSPEDAIAARADVRRARRETLVDPVVVAWDGAPPVASIRLPVRVADDDFVVIVETESGEESRWTRRQLTVLGAVTADDVVELSVAMPHGFGPGRHRLRLETAVGHASATLIAAPAHIAALHAPRSWGVFAPVYALHTRARAGTGAGDLAALDQLGRWLAGRGGSVIGTLPILAMFVGHGKEPADPSPYAPVSRRYWNELYLDLGAVPELAGTPPLDEPAPGRRVDLPRLAARRRPLLETAVARLDATPVRRRELERWLDAHPDTRAYADFRASAEGSGREGAALHEFVQWVMAAQLATLVGALDDRGQSLYIDLPVGTHRDGYDVAARPDLFASDGSVGAPPDDFQPSGQNWGFPPVDPEAARRDGYAYLTACLDEQLQYARLLRLDHVMGLHRLWMIPGGATATDGAYVHYPAEEHWATICLAAARHRATIVGENLGTVPPATNRAMRRHRALGIWVAQFELPNEEDHAVAPPGAGVLACIDTHDLPTFAAWWHQLAPIPRGALLTALSASGDLDTEYSELIDPQAVLAATLSWLGRSRAPIVLATLEDLWLEPNPQNIPGPDHQDETFRQRAAYGIDELDDLPSVTGALDRLALARRSTA